MKEIVIRSCRQIQNRLQMWHSKFKFTVKEHLTQWTDHWFKSEERIKVSAKQILMYRWKCCWTDKFSEWNFLEVRFFSCKAVKFHVQLQKTESSIITQICMSHIELAAFLNKICVSDFSSSVCSCDQIRETAEHIIAHCNRFTECRAVLQNSWIRQINIRELISDSEEVTCLVK